MIQRFLKKLAEMKFSSSSAETNSSDHGPWVNNSNNDNNNNNNNNNNDNDNRIERRSCSGFFCFVLFYNLLNALRLVSIMCTQVARPQSCASRVQHIERSSRATCRVPRGTKGELGY